MEVISGVDPTIHQEILVGDPLFKWLSRQNNKDIYSKYNRDTLKLNEEQQQKYMRNHIFLSLEEI